MTEIVSLYQRRNDILKGWKAGLAGRDPDTVEIQDLLPAIFEAVPDASIPEICEALRWGSRQCSIEADKLERFGMPAERREAVKCYQVAS